MNNASQDNGIRNGLAALAVGFLFALGLGIAGMTQPRKVVGFLDIFGDWDPSLAFVMAGAVAVHAVVYRLIRRRATPLLAAQWHLPGGRAITPSLVAGAFLFGVGWALAGFCPGPAVTSLASLEWRPPLFVVAMLTGMGLFRLLDARLRFRR